MKNSDQLHQGRGRREAGIKTAPPSKLPALIYLVLCSKLTNDHGYFNGVSVFISKLQQNKTEKYISEIVRM